MIKIDCDSLAEEASQTSKCPESQFCLLVQFNNIYQAPPGNKERKGSPWLSRGPDSLNKRGSCVWWSPSWTQNSRGNSQLFVQFHQDGKWGSPFHLTQDSQDPPLPHPHPLYILRPFPPTLLASFLPLPEAQGNFSQTVKNSHAHSPRRIFLPHPRRHFFQASVSALPYEEAAGENDPEGQSESQREGKTLRTSTYKYMDYRLHIDTAHHSSHVNNSTASLRGVIKCLRNTDEGGVNSA